MDSMPLKYHKLGLLIGAIIFLTTALYPAECLLKIPTTATMTPEGITHSKQQDTFYFDPAPIDQDVVEGDDVLLQCDVSNRRHIQFFWEMNNRQLANTSRRFQEDSDLRILRVDRSKDGGSFRCSATNISTGVSIRSREARLNILWIDNEARTELKQPRRTEITAGIEITIKCEVSGNSAPSIEWFKNGNRLFPSEKYRYLKNAKLKISSINVQDNGVYSCTAQNLAGMVQSTDNFILNIPAERTAHLNEDKFTRYTLAKEGDSTMLHCHYDNAMVTEWYFGESRLSNNSNGKYTIYNNGSLMIKNVVTGDAGGYICLGVSENSLDQSFMSILQIAYLKELTEESFQPRPGSGFMPLVVPEDKKLEVLCVMPDGLPTPTQRWEDHRGAIIPNEGHIKADDGLLTLTNARQEDSGNYTCVVSNTAGIQRKNIWIVVSVSPSWKEPPLSERIMEGKTVSFSCLYYGTPYPVTTILWRKGSFPVDLSHPRFTVDQERKTLTIRDVHLVDEDDYVCVVNTTGQPLLTSANAHLYVEKRLKFKPNPINTKLELGSNSKVHCRADARSPPIIRWKKEGAYDFPGHVVDVDGTLFFNGVRYSDEGNYTCIAQTETEKINVTISIEVVVKPHFTLKPKNTTAYEGYPAILHCVAEGNPIPKIEWDKNNVVNGFNKERFKTLPNGSLYVVETYLDDVGKYGCTAGNSGGFQREEVYLHVARSGGVRDIYSGKVGGDNFNMMKTIIIAVCSAVAYLAIVIGLTVYCSLRMMRAKNLRKQRESEAALQANDKAENGAVPTEHTELMEKKDHDSSLIKSDVDARSHISGVSSHPSHSSHSHQSHNSTRLMLEKLAFPRRQLQTLGMLGKGHYGDVFLAKAHLIREGEPETLVIIKSLLSREEYHHRAFCREIEMFSKLNHEHIAKVLGVCCDMEPRFLITEYSDWGDLKQYLWATRKDNGRRIQPLTAAQKTTMCSQVALGMEFMAANRFVHRDLAARNMLLSSTLDLKISNLGLCRDVYATEYFPFHQQLIPLRWMPPEAVLEDEYSTKSDVWSYGVFIWELFMLGELPHQERMDEEVLKGLKSGGEPLDIPPDCPQELYQLTLKCTAELAKDRPSFSEIVSIISDIHVDSDV